jgi:tRNA-splicing ligase RtcB
MYKGDSMQMKKVEEGIWEIPITEKEGMVVPARIIASDKLIKEMDQGVINQITNVATLPGIKKYAFCMPDGHWGYGFPIGGVAAFSLDNGVISPGGIGFDINCGVRLIRTNLSYQEVKPYVDKLMDAIFGLVPAGIGSRGFVKLNNKDFEQVMCQGASWCVKKGYGWASDLERIEENGCMEGANPDKVSSKAFSRGLDQLGTLGSGNHYLELQIAQTDKIYYPDAAEAFGINIPNQVLIMVHCGSRGFGHQIGTDYLKTFGSAMTKYGIRVNDRELACAPFKSVEGQDYYQAMVCAANMAFANRQLIMYRIREAFGAVFKKKPEDLGMDLVYDIAHNIAKIEKHEINGKDESLIVHRKGATRSFGPSRPEVPQIYKSVGQPVIAGGSMETSSYLLVGTDKSLKLTFGSSLHGAGRTMSRMQAKRKVRGTDLRQSMEQRGISIRAVSMSGLAEEAGIAYKDISEVVDIVERVGLSKKVIELKPIGNIKG